MKKGNPLRNFRLAPGVTLAFFVALALVMWRATGELFQLITFLYLGVFTAGGMTLFGLLPVKRKHLGRRISGCSGVANGSASPWGPRMPGSQVEKNCGVLP